MARSGRLRRPGRGLKHEDQSNPKTGPGTILDDAMKISGLRNIASDAKVAYPRFSLEAVIERQPDLILIGSGHADMKTLAKGFLHGLRLLEAVRKGRICFMDDALYRPGPRIPAGLEELDRWRSLELDDYGPRVLCLAEALVDALPRRGATERARR